MIAFGIVSFVALAASAMVVLSRNPVVSAMYLALTFGAVAGMFVVLGAEFLAVIQLVVYAGAILVFFLFVVMLLNLGKLPLGDTKHIQRWGGLWLAGVILIVLGVATHRAAPEGALPVLDGVAVAPVAGRPEVGNTEAVATLLYSKYILAFELTSVLLTAAVVGAVVLAQGKAPGGKS